MIEDIRSQEASIDRARSAELRRQAARDANVLRMTGALVMAGAIGFAVAFPSNNTSRDPIVAPEPHSFQTR